MRRAKINYPRVGFVQKNPQMDKFATELLVSLRSELKALLGT